MELFHPPLDEEETAVENSEESFNSILGCKLKKLINYLSMESHYIPKLGPFRNSWYPFLGLKEIKIELKLSKLSVGFLFMRPPTIIFSLRKMTPGRV